MVVNQNRQEWEYGLSVSSDDMWESFKISQILG